MRYFVSLGLVLALWTLPTAVRAQFAEEDSLSSWQVQEEGSPETISEEQRRVRNTAIGLGFSAAVFSTGVIVMVAGLTFGDCGEWWAASSETRQQCDRKAYTGVALSAVGAIGMITSGILFGKRKRERDRSRQAHDAIPRRVQWDVARSRLVF